MLLRTSLTSPAYSFDMDQKGKACDLSLQRNRNFRQANLSFSSKNLAI
jgi:hypothetical protein